MMGFIHAYFAVLVCISYNTVPFQIIIYFVFCARRLRAMSLNLNSEWCLLLCCW